MNNVLILSLVFILSACSLFENDNDGDTSSSIDCSTQAEACQLSALNYEFAWDIFGKVQEAKPSDNVFISPLSISTALSMTMNGAKGETLEEMQATLGYSQVELEDINQGYKELLESLPTLDPEVELGLANSIWYRENFAVLESFLNTNETYYKSQVESLDFNLPDAPDAINSWVDEKTNGLIDEIIKEIPPQMVMYLINAIYFKGAWLHPFDPDATIQRDFNLENGSTVPVDMMSYNKFDLNYIGTDRFQAVDIPYGDSIYSMTVFVPKDALTLSDIYGDISALTAQSEWANDFVYQEVFFSMPKFELAFEANLNETLKSMGMQQAFVPNGADLTGIAPADLYISEVKHKAFIKVDEEGTEAGAVTSVGVGVTSIPLIPFVVLDRPFFFIIRENQSNNVLFMGKLMDPS